MKIGIVGTSPIMTILAIALSKKNKVVLFEKRKNFGGAWSFFKYKSMYIHNKTNVIFGTKTSEDKYIKNIIKYLKKNFKMKIKKNKNIFRTILKYKPKNIFRFEINKIYRHLKKSNVKIINKEVFDLSIKKDKVYLNEEKFDKVYIPTFIGLNKAKINKKTFYFDYNKITSKHIVIVSKKKFLDKFYYVEEFNNVFDRALQEKNFFLYLFTARIKTNFFGLSSNKLIEMSNFNIKKKNLLISRIFKYENCHRNYLQIKKLNRLNRFSKINVVDTAQFVPAFKKLNLTSYY